MDNEQTQEICEICQGQHDPVLHKKLHRREYMRVYKRLHSKGAYSRGHYKVKGVE